MSDSWCDYYTSPPVGVDYSVWPQRQYPGYLFPGISDARRLRNKQAWDFYELVEAADAAARVRLSGPMWSPPPTSRPSPIPTIWFPLTLREQVVLYHKGALLHQQVCPGISWQSQRSLGILQTPVTNVWPSLV